jgi:pimeloyl-ACP methyl ester carboxylesterase
LVQRDEITDRLGEISPPTLIIHGSADAATPMWNAEQLRDGIPDVRGLVVIEGAGHAANMGQPERVDQVNRAIADFLHSL